MVTDICRGALEHYGSGFYDVAVFGLVDGERDIVSRYSVFWGGGRIAAMRTRDFMRKWQAALALAAGMVVITPAVILGFVELEMSDYGARRLTTIGLAAVGISAGLFTVAIKEEPWKGICAVFAFTGTGTALIVNA